MASKLLLAAKKTKIASTALGLKERPRGSDWVPGTAGNTTSTVDVSISCRHLINKDLLSKSDPLCVVLGRPPGSRSWVTLMRTEIIDNDLNPDFVEKLRMEYSFEKIQQLRFELYDIDSPSPTKLSQQDTLGYVDTTLGAIVSSGTEGLTMELSGISQPPGKECALVILTAEEVAAEKDEILLKLAGSSVGSWNGCFPPKIYFVLYKLNDGGRYIAVHRSKGGRGTSPSWAQFRISFQRLCTGDMERELKIELFQVAFSGNAVHPLGAGITTLSKLMSSTPERIPIMSPKGQPTPGSIRVVSCTMSPIDTFLDYIQGGTQIQCSFGIDFTASNGEPTDSVSLHYTGPVGGQPNVYEQAIYAVGTIIKDYDTDGTFAAYGFGARLPPKGDPSHFFHLNLGKSPYCGSVPGVLEAYRNCIRKVVLFGPTNFAPTINHVAKLASKSKSGEVYHILVIITDGVITDMTKTKKAIVEASAYPMSIIIIGVGEADFGAMEELDADAVMVSHRGKLAQRDIVQFVAYRSARVWMGCTGEHTLSDVPDVEEAGEEGEGFSQDGKSRTGAKSYDSGDDDEEENVNPEDATDEPPEDSEAKDDTFNRLAGGHLAKEVLFELPDQIRGYMLMKGIKPDMIPKKAKKKEGDEEGDKPAKGQAESEAPAK